MTATTLSPLLSELLRPQSLADLNLPDSLEKSFERMVKNGSVMNLLFYGKPGIGKTSAARILIKALNADALEFNGSYRGGNDPILNAIESFSTGMSLIDAPKICFIDEADHMSRAVQDSLRYSVENSSHNTRYLLTANDVTKITPAIRSRFQSVCFDVRPLEVSGVINKMVNQYTRKLSEIGMSFDPERLREIVVLYFPDLRSIANQFQLELG